MSQFYPNVGILDSNSVGRRVTRKAGNLVRQEHLYDRRGWITQPVQIGSLAERRVMS